MSPAPAYERIRSIGGSDVAVILGLSKYCSEAELYDRITGAVGEKPSQGHMNRGKAMEDMIIAMYSEASGRQTWQVDRIMHPTLPAHASPDAMQSIPPEQLAAMGHEDDMGFGILEP
jgi:predicted phage-related endonuclease